MSEFLLWVILVQLVGIGFTLTSINRKLENKGG
jgi:hypothetical protein